MGSLRNKGHLLRTLFLYIVSSASMFELRFGFQSYIAPRQQFCPDLAAGSACPISPGQNFTIERVYTQC
jgi:hypothetical protein